MGNSPLLPVSTIQQRAQFKSATTGKRRAQPPSTFPPPGSSPTTSRLCHVEIQSPRSFIHRLTPKTLQQECDFLVLTTPLINPIALRTVRRCRTGWRRDLGDAGDEDCESYGRDVPFMLSIKKKILRYVGGAARMVYRRRDMCALNGLNEMATYAPPELCK